MADLSRRADRCGHGHAAAASARSRGRAIALVVVTLVLAAAVGGSPGRAAAANSDGGRRDRAHSVTAFVYAGVGPELREYWLDAAAAKLTERRAVTLPEDIQAGCVDPSGRYVFVAWSNGTNISPGSRHGLSVFRIDSASGALVLDGAPISLPSRPIYVTLDRNGQHALVAYTSPSGVTVHRIAPDGTASPPLRQRTLRLGVYAHQILLDPSNSVAILVARGNVPAAGRRESPGALNVLGYESGMLTGGNAMAPNGGFGFHPRYIGFDPQGKWVFVSLSQRNAIGVLEMRQDGELSTKWLFEKNSLAHRGHVRQGQLSGVLHVHPDGRFVYLANRGLGTRKVGGVSVFAGGENDLAVFAVNRTTGEPSLIQNIDTRGIVPGEFAFDPSGKILVLANMRHLPVEDRGRLRLTLPSLAVFRVGRDGRLSFVRKYDVGTGKHTLFWMGIGRRP